MSEELNAIKIENEQLKNDISEMEILHKAEVEELQKKIQELKERKQNQSTCGDSVKNAFAYVISELTPIEIAEKLINSTKTVEYGFKIGTFESNILGCQELREISRYLEVYCDFNETE